MVMSSLSARSTAPNHTLELAARRTPPMSVAVGATHARSCTSGVRPPKPISRGSVLRVMVGESSAG